MRPGSGTLVIDISGEKAEAFEGTYQCTAHNEHGTAVSNNIVIRQSSKTSHYIQFHCSLFKVPKYKLLYNINVLLNSGRPSVNLLDVCDLQGPPCGRRSKMRPSLCKWGSPLCYNAGPLQGFPLLSSSGWITVSHLLVYS